MARITTESKPAREENIVRRTEGFEVKTPLNGEYVIELRRVRRDDGFVQADKTFTLKMSDVAGEQCGASGFTVGQISEFIAQYFDAKAAALNEE